MSYLGFEVEFGEVLYREPVFAVHTTADNCTVFVIDQDTGRPTAAQDYAEQYGDGTWELFKTGERPEWPLFRLPPAA